MKIPRMRLNLKRMNMAAVGIVRFFNSDSCGELVCSSSKSIILLRIKTSYNIANTITLN